MPIITVTVVVLSFLQGIAQSSNPFERGPFRSQCLQRRKMTNCETKLTTLYTNVSRSYTNGTEADTFFYLFTRQNRYEPEDLQQCGGGLPSNTFYNSKVKTIIVVHGYLDGVCLSAWMREMKEEFLKKGPYNIILVDWTWGNAFDYADAFHNLRITASQIAIVIRTIMKQTGVDGERFYIVGHSLGAHMAGFVGQQVKIGRITGLEPAGPGFTEASIDERLNPSDADIVDCMHTNGGPCLPQLGYIIPICDADFYVNGGVKQFSCIPYTIISYLKGDIRYATMSISFDSCSHNQAIQYYKASINPTEEFVGVKCENYNDFRAKKCNSCGEDGSKCAVMGMNYDEYPRATNKNTSTKYYLDTTLNCPYVDNKNINLQGYKAILQRKS